MQVFTSVAEFKNHNSKLRNNGVTLGFVPTMGALHQGHISLVKEAQEQCQQVSCSIFVNPTQFNNATDLEKYPRTPEQDIKLLKQAGVSAILLPSVDEVYPTKETWEHYWEYVGSVLEGKNRPGHFDGVGQIVQKLLDWAMPHKAFFGQKDYQQCLIVKKLVTDFNINTEIVTCPIMREKDGLAMSSRNVRLNPEARQNATTLYKALQYLQENKQHSIESRLPVATEIITNNPAFTLEYLEVRDKDSFEPIPSHLKPNNGIALVAAFIDGVRLIDNILI